MSFCFWAWPCIPFAGNALLPQGQFKLLLVRDNFLPYMLFIWGVQRKASREKPPRTTWQGLVYLQPQEDARAPQHSRVTATPHALPRGNTSLGSWSRIPPLMEGVHKTAVLNSIVPLHTWRHLGKDSELTHWSPCLKDNTPLFRLGAIWLC